MNDELKNICSDPYGHYELLKNDDEKTWRVVKKTFNPLLSTDIMKSIRKKRHEFKLYRLLSEEDELTSLAFDVGKEAWETFRDILIAENSKFVFQGVNEAYNYLRVISYNIIRDRFKTYLAVEAKLRKQYSFEELEDNYGLDNFLYINGGYNEENPEVVYIRKEQASLLVQVMDQLPENHQLILAYKYFEGMSSAEIAAELNMTADSINTTLSRIRQFLRRSLK